ncbi:histidine phosphatase family protein [Sporobolomyces koalae]|uniref:histidine phosphatase family protein n=1 Tax=Sporobolomyces koalae TaxID=500713 RepID=UPI00317CA2A8
MAPVILTLVRHGESVDNLTSLWAGHRDAPLTNYGYTQAQRLGDHFKDVPITAIYASDLKRAQTTARCVWEKNRSDPKPPFTISPLLREQFFGEAEGMPWDAGKYHSAHLPWEDHRAFRLAPNAESLDDVSARASQVLRHFILPHLVATASVPSTATFPEQHHLVLFAHGIWLSEMMFAIKLAGDPRVRFVKSQGGYQNTAWSRIEIELDDDDNEGFSTLPRTSPACAEGEGVERVVRTDGNPDPDLVSPPAPSEAAPSHEDESTREDDSDSSNRPPLSPRFASLLPTLPPVPPRDPALPPVPDLATMPRIRHRVVAFNQSQHLVGLKRTKGGIGSGEWDDKQRGLKEFFAGGGGAGVAKS